nr:hypothetical protein CFP56_42126 [Quercus suber]
MRRSMPKQDTKWTRVTTGQQRRSSRLHKARVQQAQAKDWAFVDAWLAKKYGQQLGPFERNEETLQVLLKLVNLNESADEQRTLSERVEKSALQAMAKRAANEDGTYSATVKHLSAAGQDNLDVLAKSAVLLQSTNLLTMSDRLCSLLISHFDVYEQFRQVEAQQEALDREHTRLKEVLTELKSDAFKPPEDLLEQTSEFTGNAKHLRAKIGEYDERLQGVRAQNSSSPKIENLVQRMIDVQTQREQLVVLNGKLSAFQSLPPDAKAARNKVEAARNELRQLVTKRDSLFEGLVDG